MKDDCLDIGIIQAFMDGELAHDERARVSGHFALCDACTFLLTEAEDESAIVFPALEREFNTLVPTQRLWTKINASIVTERDNKPFWHKAWAFLTVTLASPSFAVAASLVIMVGICAAVWFNWSETPTQVSELRNPTFTASPTNTIALSSPSSVATDSVSTPPVKTDQRFERASYRADDKRTVRVVDAAARTASNTGSSFMPGEESYVKTISTLNKSVEGQKDIVLRPGERIAYERDLAVVNDAIARMRVEVKRNPKNESAKQVLYSSYQNKIDLLNSVAQKEELVASLR